MDPILHITTRAAWETAVAHPPYTADSLDSEGFIHCSTPAQAVGTANLLFAGQTGLVLLVIDPARLDAELIYEDLYDIGEAFPHIYGPLNLDAVVRVVDFPSDANGRFALPDLMK